jgi:hypothetical protein
MKRDDELNMTPEQKARMERMLCGGERDTQRRAVHVSSPTIIAHSSRVTDDDLQRRAAANGMTVEQQARFERILAAIDDSEFDGGRPERELSRSRRRGRIRGHNL